MKEMFLLKYGEIALKGANRASFESVLMKNIRRRLADLGEFTVMKSQSTIAVIPQNGDPDLDEAYDRLSKVFGISAMSRSAVVEKSFESICAGLPYLDGALAGPAPLR